MLSSKANLLARLSAAKPSFVTRHVEMARAQQLAEPVDLTAGDIVLARVSRVRQHTRVELPSGRRAHLFEGDELILAAGRRYATDQFVAELPKLGHAHLVAAGGIAAQVIDRHGSVKPATEIEIVAALADQDGRVMNLRQFAPLLNCKPAQRIGRIPRSLLVIGTGMNSGKTTMVTAATRALKQAGQKVMACKLTGTGSGNDLWQYQDAGADLVYDFTDAGLCGTWQETPQALLSIARCFRQAASEASMDYLIVELADGLLQTETMDLIQSDSFRALFDGCLVAATCSVGAVYAARTLSSLKVPVLAIGGCVSQSPLYQREIRAQTGLPVLSDSDLARFNVLNSHLGMLGVAA